MNISTSTTTVVTIELTEAEARTALVEPQAFQAQLRAALQPVAPHRNGNGHQKPRNPKGARRSVAPSQAATLACPTCGKMLKARGMTLHQHKAHPERMQP
jgi:hypothetical protein